jgi:hypothetical protein
VFESGFLASLDDEQRVRYYKWWRKYLFLKRANQGAFVVLLAVWILRLRYDNLKYLQAPLFLAAVAFGMWWSFLDCPRCGEQFTSGKLRAYFGEECQNCGLSYLQLSAIGKPQNLH